MRIGQQRHRVSIQRLTAGSPQQDAGGSPDENWTTLFTVWAEIAPLRGRELLAAQQVSTEVTGTVKMRYRADYTITGRDRVLFGSRVYDILAPVNILERNNELVLYVREGTNNG